MGFRTAYLGRAPSNRPPAGLTVVEVNDVASLLARIFP
jgi:hypothetical protein